MGYKWNPFTGNFDRVEGGSASGDIETITGNSGGPVGPDGAFNINLLGSGSITVTGNPGTNTLTIDDDGTLADVFTADAGSATPTAGNLNLFGDTTQGLSTSGAGDTVTFTNSDATESQKGVSELATDSEAIAGSDATKTLVPTSLKAKLGVQTSNALPFGQSDSSALGWTTALTNGQLVIGATGAAPAAAHLIGNNGITVVNGVNTITLATTASVATSYNTDSGSAVPALHILNVLGGTLLGTTGLGSTVTINADDNVVGSIAGDSGTATPAGNSFTIAGDTGLTTAGASDTITISLDGGVVGQTITGDSGGALSPTAGNWNILGGTGCATSGAASTLTINLDAEVPLSFPTDSGTATPSANALTVAGGSNINTSGAGATVTVNLDTNISVGTIDCTQVTVDPGASGDSFIQFDINTTGEFRIGVDDTDDSFRISQGSALGTNDTQIIAASGEVTMPLTPAFLAKKSASSTNATGDNTNFTVICDTEVFDQNSDYDNGTGIFTAPVTGRHLFAIGIATSAIGSQTTGFVSIVTSNETYYGLSVNPTNVKTASNTMNQNMSVLADLDAADTCVMKVQFSGSTKTVTAFGNNTGQTYFSGKLEC